MVRFIVQFVDYKFRPILTKISPDVSCDALDENSFQVIMNFCRREAPYGYEIIGCTVKTGKECFMKLTPLNQSFMKQKFKSGIQAYDFYANLSLKKFAEPIPPTEKKAETAHTRTLHRILNQQNAVPFAGPQTTPQAPRQSEGRSDTTPRGGCGLRRAV